MIETGEQTERALLIGVDLPHKAVKETEADYYREHAPALAQDPPASTVCQVASLSKENMLVEFDITALK